MIIEFSGPSGAGSTAKHTEISVGIGEDRFPVHRFDCDGFTVPVGQTPKLRGYVDVYKGTVPMLRCLIVAAERIGDVWSFEIKNATLAGKPPAPDYAVTGSPYPFDH